MAGVEVIYREVLTLKPNQALVCEVIRHADDSRVFSIRKEERNGVESAIEVRIRGSLFLSYRSLWLLKNFFKSLDMQKMRQLLHKPSTAVGGENG